MRQPAQTMPGITNRRCRGERCRARHAGQVRRRCLLLCASGGRMADSSACLWRQHHRRRDSSAPQEPPAVQPLIRRRRKEKGKCLQNAQDAQVWCAKRKCAVQRKKRCRRRGKPAHGMSRHRRRETRRCTPIVAKYGRRARLNRRRLPPAPPARRPPRTKPSQHPKMRTVPSRPGYA